ncbi:class I SAM-dependent methyltransferase [Geothrix paludis]|uniref:class I SAM-dependent methyltransferase n=1 Tax=Geothrix paludis TaxID=2922722 RepID=UPI001FACDADE|nr:class I SAM-dependent methyltransferase [Geothrix paludis]
MAWKTWEAPFPPALRALLEELQKAGKWIPSSEVDPEDPQIQLGSETPPLLKAWIHPRIFFPSYAHEWSQGMLLCAARLTLELNERLLEVGWELKDASPSNVLFEGPRPIFVDHLSPTPRSAGQMGWVAYGQFIRTFLIPQILHRLNKTPLGWIYLSKRDGLSPEEAYSQLSVFQRARPGVLTAITLPTLFTKGRAGSSHGGLKTWRDSDENMGRAITGRLLHGLRKQLDRWVSQTAPDTAWSQYDQAGESYSPGGLRAKEGFIQESLERCTPKAVLDLGCNTGRFSRLAAKAGARVVAVDGDAACVDRLWWTAATEQLDILPLVMDLGRPSPPLGWENGEEAPFLERTKDRFDMVLALALIHHLLVRERIPLERVIGHLSQQTTRWLVIEWVPFDDPQFQRLAGPNAHLYAGLTVASFEQALEAQFDIVARRRLDGGDRCLYLASRRPA